MMNGVISVKLEFQRQVFEYFILFTNINETQNFINDLKTDIFKKSRVG